MKNKLLLCLFGWGAFSAFSQEIRPHRCLTTEYGTHLETQIPGSLQGIQSAFEENAARIRSTNYQKSDDVYIIPVVFHVVYNTPAENLEDSVVLNQLQVLNEDFNRMNPDSMDLRTQFFPYKGNAKIRFVLAQFDPNGNPTTGITRTQTTRATFFSIGALAGDFSALENVKSTAQGGHDAWNPTKYLNIWICNMAMSLQGATIPALLGYAKPPLNMPNWPAGSVPAINDGVVLQYHTVGRNNPNSPVSVMNETISFFGRTATHEVGHYLGLRHIWGDGDCSMDDGIDDTPNMSASSETDCDKTKNTCVDNIDGVDLPDLVENFMDYAAEDCQNMFTAQQVNLMRSVLENQRYELVHNNVNSISKVDPLATRLYPNPANTSINVVTSQVLNGMLHVVDVTGRVVAQVQVNSDRTIIQVQDLFPGIYQVTFEGKQIARFVKE